MPKYVLTCSCGSVDFDYDYDGWKFVCTTCNEAYSETEAGNELMGEDDNDDC